MRRLAIMAAAMTLAWGGSGLGAPKVDPESAIVSDLVVRPVVAGPAWWRVSDADTVVYIIGMPGSTVPSGLKWDRRALDRRLKDANVFITSLTWPVGKLRDIPAQTPFDIQLGPELKSRFEAAIGKIGRPRSRYEEEGLLQVTDRLAEDYRAFAHLTTAEPFRAMRQAARAAHVPLDQSVYPARLDLLEDQIDPEPCFAGVLSAIEAGPQPNRAAAQAWARGDVAGALAAPRGDRWWRCTGGPWLAIENHTARIEAALKTPGHAVAAITLHSLLAENGVLQRLKADGFEVVDPAGFTP
jgi:hypothetical protein